jgi:hypothetical protein
MGWASGHRSSLGGSLARSAAKSLVKSLGLHSLVSYQPVGMLSSGRSSKWRGAVVAGRVADGRSGPPLAARSASLDRQYLRERLPPRNPPLPLTQRTRSSRTRARRVRRWLAGRAGERRRPGPQQRLCNRTPWPCPMRPARVRRSGWTPNRNVSAFPVANCRNAFRRTFSGNNPTGMNKYSDRRINMNRYSRVQNLNAASSCKYRRESHL